MFPYGLCFWMHCAQYWGVWLTITCRTVRGKNANNITIFLLRYLLKSSLMPLLVPTICASHSCRVMSLSVSGGWARMGSPSPPRRRTSTSTMCTSPGDGEIKPQCFQCFRATITQQVYPHHPVHPYSQGSAVCDTKNAILGHFQSLKLLASLQPCEIWSLRGHLAKQPRGLFSLGEQRKMDIQHVNPLSLNFRSSPLKIGFLTEERWAQDLILAEAEHSPLLITKADQENVISHTGQAKRHPRSAEALENSFT